MCLGELQAFVLVTVMLLLCFLHVCFFCHDPCFNAFKLQVETHSRTCSSVVTKNYGQKKHMPLAIRCNMQGWEFEGDELDRVSGTLQRSCPHLLPKPVLVKPSEQFASAQGSCVRWTDNM